MQTSFLTLTSAEAISAGQAVSVNASGLAVAATAGQAVLGPAVGSCAAGETVGVQNPWGRFRGVSATALAAGTQLSVGAGGAWSSGSGPAVALTPASSAGSGFDVAVAACDPDAGGGGGSAAVVDASSVGLSPSGSVPSVADAKTNADLLEAALATAREVRFTVPGDYYFARTPDGAGHALADDHGAVRLPATFRSVLVAPGVRLLRHAGYAPMSGAANCMSGALFCFANETVRNEGFRLYGGGKVGRCYPTTSDDLHTNRFVNADHIQIEDIEFVSDVGAGAGLYAGKYAVALQNIGRFTGRNIRFSGNRTVAGGSTTAHASDGLHFHGPGSNILIDGISGDTGDDMVAMTIRDYVGYMYAGWTHGPFKNVIVRNVRCDSGGRGNCVRFMGCPATITTSGTNHLAFSGATWTESTRTLTSVGAFSAFTWSKGIKLWIDSGTNVIPGWYTIQSKTSADAVVLEVSCQSSAGAASAIVVTHAGWGGFHNILVDGVYGPRGDGYRHVEFGDDNEGWAQPDRAYACCGVQYEDVTVRNVGGKLSSSSGTIHLAAYGLEDLAVENVYGDPSSGGQWLIEQAWTPSAPIPRPHLKRLICRNLQNLNQTNGANLVNLVSTIPQVVVVDSASDFVGTSGGSALVNVSGPTGYPAIIGHLRVDGCHLKNTGGQAANFISVSNGRVNDAVGTGCVFAGAAALLKGDTTAANGISRLRLVSPVFLDAGDPGSCGNTYYLAQQQAEVTIQNFQRSASTNQGNSDTTAAYNPRVVYERSKRTLIVDYADFAYAASKFWCYVQTSKHGRRLGTFPRGARIVRVRTRTLTAFTGTSITGLTLDVGESNTPTDSKWVTAGADIMAANTEVLTDVAAASQLGSFTAERDLQLKLNITGAGTALSAGRLLIEIEWDGFYG